MATLADLLAYRDRLRDARYSGARRLRDANGEEIEYRSDRELAAAMAALEAEIKGFSNRRPNNIIYPITSKGL